LLQFFQCLVAETFDEAQDDGRKLGLEQITEHVEIGRSTAAEPAADGAVQHGGAEIRHGVGKQLPNKVVIWLHERIPDEGLHHSKYHEAVVPAVAHTRGTRSPQAAALTRKVARFIVAATIECSARAAMSTSNFKTLESKVDELIKLCSDMKKENQLLRDKENQWQHERETLLGKHQLARVRLEKVLRRLKALEEGQA
jgi:cell division protein ZapB